jgi:hypothetical protein
VANRILNSLVPIFALVAVACGGNAYSNANGGAAGSTADGGQVGTGGAGTGGSMPTGGTGTGGSATGGFGNVPSYCEIDTSLPGPYATTFTLTNTQSFALYLYQGCFITHSIRSCAEGYSRDLPTNVFCTPECGSGSSGCVVCGACYSEPLLLEPGESAEISWSGQLYQTVDGPACSCYNAWNAQSGIYRIDVPVFATAEQAQAQQPSFTVSQEFQLPALNGAVDVGLFVGF